VKGSQEMMERIKSPAATIQSSIRVEEMDKMDKLKSMLVE
jgi:hypothetical protein